MIYEEPTSASSYNSLQGTLSHQFSKTLSGQVSYVWSHCIDNGSFTSSLEQWAQLMTQPYNQNYDYGNCNFDIRHNLSANGVYSLPFKGNRLVQGWQVSSIVSLNSGLPLNVSNYSYPEPSNLAPQWATRPNYTFAAGCRPDKLVKKWVNTSTTPGQAYWSYEWFDPSCYAAQSNGYVGNVVRNSLAGPHYFNMDFSLLKSTKLTERLNMQFRAEFFNVLNHFNVSAPNTGLGYAVGSTNVPTGYAGGQQGLPRQIQFALKFDF